MEPLETHTWFMYLDFRLDPIYESTVDPRPVKISQVFRPSKTNFSTCSDSEVHPQSTFPYNSEN